MLLDWSVPVFVTVISTPGMTAPDVSVTVPVIVPVVCARPLTAASIEAQRAKQTNDLNRFFFMDSSIHIPGNTEVLAILIPLHALACPCEYPDRGSILSHG